MKFSLNELVLKDLSPDEMRRIYNSHMVNVFPQNELKPCDAIYREMLEDRFLACGLFAGEELVAYVFSGCIPGRDQLFCQYVVVKEQYRSRGVGALLLDRLAERYAMYRCMMADVEDPDFAMDADDRLQRERRIRFYLRNGFRLTAIRVRAYGVDYRIIVRDISAHVLDDEVFEAVTAIYESMAAPGTFPDMFRFSIDED